MLALQHSKSHQGTCKPNVLPCRINHSGDVNATRKYWDPISKDGKTVAYFRGRKLYGRPVHVPEGYKGVVATMTEDALAKDITSRTQHQDEEDEDEPEVCILAEEAQFEEMIIWGHEVVVDEQDPYVRGVEEWMRFAGAIHADGLNVSEVTEKNLTQKQRWTR